MTQIEFEQQLREMRQQKGREVKNIEKMQVEVKEEIARLQGQYDELRNRLHRLQQERSMYGQRRIQIEKEWGDRIAQFQKENFTTSRALNNVSDWAIINELKARGFHGQFSNETMDIQHVIELNEKLNSTDGKTDTAV